MNKIPPHKPFKKRTAGRLAAVQALFQLEQTEASPSEVVAEFLSLRFKEKTVSVETTFFSKLVIGAWVSHAKSDEIIAGALKDGWTVARLESVTRAILRASLYEIINTKTPTAVIINEYLDLTRSFFDDTEVAFVNGVLNAVAKKIRPTVSALSTPSDKTSTE